MVTNTYFLRGKKKALQKQKINDVPHLFSILRVSKSDHIGVRCHTPQILCIQLCCAVGQNSNAYTAFNPNKSLTAFNPNKSLGPSINSALCNLKNRISLKKQGLTRTTIYVFESWKRIITVTGTITKALYFQEKNFTSIEEDNNKSS